MVVKLATRRVGPRSRAALAAAECHKEAVEAANFYCSIFPDSAITNVTTLHDTPSGDCDLVSFTLSGNPFMAISAGPLFTFNESILFMVYYETQDEIDFYRNSP